MHVETLLNARQSAELLKLHRPQFYALMKKTGLRPVMQTGRIKLYDLREIEQLKMHLNRKIFD